MKLYKKSIHHSKCKNNSWDWGEFTGSVLGGALVGSITSQIQGGDFAEGFVTGLTVSTVNHAMHSMLKPSTPYLVNKSDETVYFKPESNMMIDGVKYLDGGAYPLSSGGTFNGGIDGVKTSKYSDAIFKVPNYNRAVVLKGGDVKLFATGNVFERFIGWGVRDIKAGWKNKQTLPASNFKKLFDAPVGKGVFGLYHPLNPRAW